MDGILNIYKQKGYTSHDVVAVVRRILHQKKVGHTGTLDPEAEGVLPVCVGRATKLADYIMAEKKSYRALITLGVATDTQDAQGQVLATKQVDFNQERIHLAVSSFVGEIWQTPPMYSAIKIQGKKLYELAREGKEVVRPKRQVTIHSIEIRQYLPPNQLEIDVVCSKGTYIRTLAADIGEKLGCGAHMAELLRTQSGQFFLDHAIPLHTLQEMMDAGHVDAALLPMDNALGELNRVWIMEKASKLLYNGGRISQSFIKKSILPVSANEKLLVYDCKDQLTGIYEAVFLQGEEGLWLKPLTMLMLTECPS